ncbi:hypothetical protein ACTXT7_005167 [Hymenolepis weldensis]
MIQRYSIQVCEFITPIRLELKHSRGSKVDSILIPDAFKKRLCSRCAFLPPPPPPPIPPLPDQPIKLHCHHPYE